MKSGLTLALPKGRLLDPAIEPLRARGERPIIEWRKRTSKRITRRWTGDPVAEAGRRAGLRDLRRGRPRDRRQGHPARAGARRLRAARPRLRLLPAGGGRAEELWERDDPAKWSWVRVATKYPRLTEQYFSERGVQVEIVRLDGSIELAPLVGLAERIVDLVQSGGDAARQRPRGGRRDHAVDRPPDRQPRLHEDGVRGRHPAHRRDARAEPPPGAVTVRTLDARALGVDAVVARDRRPSTAAESTAVDEILAAVRARGDAALLDHTARFDASAPPLRRTSRSRAPSSSAAAR